MKHKENKPRITRKKNGEIVILKNWEIPVFLAEELKEKAKKEGFSETFLIRKALENMLLQTHKENL